MLYKICQENNLLKSEEEMLQITNYNNRPAIKMHFTQERDCVYFQKKINCYFAGQRRWTLIANLPFGIKKCYIIIYEYINSFFSLMPFVHNILRNVLRLLGFRKPQILNF